MSSTAVCSILILASAFASNAHSTHLLTDINKISRYWGHLSPYADNPDTVFGVEYSGLPAGCQVESVQTLQRHADRLPSFGIEDGSNIMRFSSKLSNFTSAHPNAVFTGQLDFLNTWQNKMTKEGLLTGRGAVSEFNIGNNFWNQYGRILFNASVAQVAYDPYFANGTARPKIVLRTTEQSRIHNSLINWALGFFGTSRAVKPDPSFLNATLPYEVVVIPEETKIKWNNTLASFISCTNIYDEPEEGFVGERHLMRYIQKYLGPTTKRLQNFVPAELCLTINDVHAMQLLCAYETAYIGASEFCNLFTEDEWVGFESGMEIKYYYEFSHGHPSGRAQGIGYVHEILARLNHSLILSSETSVNSTLNSNPATFPVNQPLYADFTHDDIIISALAAMSIDYFHAPPSLSQFPPDPDRKFILSKITPFGGNLVTESIGCSSPDPSPERFPRVQYSVGQNGYNSTKASHKFVRMRLNNGIVPLNTIRGGACGDDTTGRIDGMCALKDFMKSQENATALANYQYICFGKYTIEDEESGKDWDGTMFDSE